MTTHTAIGRTLGSITAVAAAVLGGQPDDRQTPSEGRVTAAGCRSMSDVSSGSSREVVWLKMSHPPRSVPAMQLPADDPLLRERAAPRREVDVKLVSKKAREASRHKTFVHSMFCASGCTEPQPRLLELPQRRAVEAVSIGSGLSPLVRWLGRVPDMASRESQ